MAGQEELRKASRLTYGRKTEPQRDEADQDHTAGGTARFLLPPFHAAGTRALLVA